MSLIIVLYWSIAGGDVVCLVMHSIVTLQSRETFKVNIVEIALDYCPSSSFGK